MAGVKRLPTLNNTYTSIIRNSIIHLDNQILILYEKIPDNKSILETDVPKIKGTSKKRGCERGLLRIFQLNPGQNVRTSFRNLANLGLQLFQDQGRYLAYI